MQRFRCPNCAAEVFVSDLQCVGCQSEIALDPVAGAYVDVGAMAVCVNRAAIDCNFVATVDGRCRSCVLTEVVPPPEVDAARAGWIDAERAKRRLVLQLLALGLLTPEPSDTDPRFEMLWSGDGSVTIGHADGVITLDVGEADDVRRERLRNRLSEPYRTMLGHLRHEIGHFYWPRMADEDGALERLREAFGDETVDYQESIDRHYRDGPPDGWSDTHISEYATMHPWEDWAESFAHYLHLRDVLDTASNFELTVGRTTLDGGSCTFDAPGDAHPDFRRLQEQWTGLTVAINALNRSMDQPDLYPFAPSDAVVAKVEIVHDLVGSLNGRGSRGWRRMLRPVTRRR